MFFISTYSGMIACNIQKFLAFNLYWINFSLISPLKLSTMVKIYGNQIVYIYVCMYEECVIYWGNNVKHFVETHGDKLGLAMNV
jgi:hypothetical protein